MTTQVRLEQLLDGDALRGLWRSSDRGPRGDDRAMRLSQRATERRSTPTRDHQISRRPVSRGAKRTALRKPHRGLVATTRRVLRQAERTMKCARRGWQRLSGKARCGVPTLQRVMDLRCRVMAQPSASSRASRNRCSRSSASSSPTPRFCVAAIHKPTEYGQMSSAGGQGRHRHRHRRRDCAQLEVARAFRRASSTGLRSGAACTCMARRWRGAHLTPQAHLRDVPHTLPK